MPLRNTSDPKHWRDRAAQMRALALSMNDPNVVILMSDLATDYDLFADRASDWWEQTFDDGTKSCGIRGCLRRGAILIAVATAGGWSFNF